MKMIGIVGLMAVLFILVGCTTYDDAQLNGFDPYNLPDNDPGTQAAKTKPVADELLPADDEPVQPVLPTEVLPTPPVTTQPVVKPEAETKPASRDVPLSSFTIQPGVYMNSGTGSPPEYVNKVFTKTEMPRLFDGKQPWVIDNVEVNATIKETYQVTLNALFDADSNVEDLVNYTDRGQFSYTVTFSPGIPTNYTAIKTNSMYIPLLGEWYKVLSATSTQIVLQRKSDNRSITIMAGKAFPENASSSKLWEVAPFVTSKREPGRIGAITIRNADKVWDDSNPLKSVRQNLSGIPPGDYTATFLEGTSWSGVVPSIQFSGFDTNGNDRNTTVSFDGSHANVIGAKTIYGSINFTTDGGILHQITPLIKLETSNDPTSVYVFNFGDKSYSYTFNRSTNRFILKRGNLTSTTFPSASIDADVNVWSDRVQMGSQGIIRLAYRQNDYDVEYRIKRGKTTSGTQSDNLYLMLNGNQYLGGLIGNAGIVYFLGTIVDDNASQFYDLNASQFPDYNGFYFPHENSRDNVSYYDPSLTDFAGFNPSSAPHYYHYAVFRISEGHGSGWQSNPGSQSYNFGRFTILIDTEDGWSGTVDTTADNRTGYSNNGTAVYYKSVNNNLQLSEDNDASDYWRAWTDYGTKVQVRSRDATFNLPFGRWPTLYRVTEVSGANK